MARTISDEELQLKRRARRRLIGAIVLVTAAAVILPMVLDSEPKPLSHNVDIQIPSPDSGEFKPKGSSSAPSVATPQVQSKAAAASGASNQKPAAAPPVEVANPSPAASTTEKATAPDAPAAAADSKASADPSKSASADTPKSASANASKSAAKDGTREQTQTSTAAGAYAVQVAALADARKVKELEKQMSGAGLKTYTEVVSTQAGEVTRVRAGPYASREAAEKARVQLKKVGLEGKIVPK